MNEENEEEFIINDNLFDLRQTLEKLLFSKKIIISSIILGILAILLITLILLTKSSNDDKFSDKQVACDINFI